jgi:hypothetical protein
LTRDTLYHKPSLSAPTANVPTEVSQPHISIFQFQADLSRIEVEITGMYAAMDEPQCPRQVLQKSSSNLDHLVFPVRRLPPEIVSQIFLQLLPKNWKEDFIFCRCTRLLLGQICSFWRQVALSTPELWAFIGIEILPGRGLSDAAMVKTWLERSGQCSLILRTDWSPRTKIFSTDIDPIMDATIPLSHRWTEARFRLTPNVVDRLAAIKGSIPSLQILVIDFQYTSCTQPINVFEDAPRLRCLEIGIAISPYWLTVPWAQLTRCRLASGTTTDCIELLSQSPNLVDCELSPRWVDDWPDDILSHVDILIPQLQSLNINSGNFVDPANLFNRLSLPSLHKFRYASHGQWINEWADQINAWDNGAFVALLSRSSCPLQTLSLGVKLSQEDLIECLQCTPFLNDLHLSDQGASCVSTTSLSHLTNRDTGSGLATYLVPKLQKFSFDHYSTLDGPAFADMVQSRWGLEAMTNHSGKAELTRLQTVSINFDLVVGEEEQGTPDLAFDPETIERLRKLRAEGLNISILMKGEHFDI